jgi:hypothetical protein
VERTDPFIGGTPSTRAPDGSGRLPPEQISDRGAQRGEIVSDDPPDDWGIDTPVLMADQVAERTYVRPAEIWLRRQKLFGQKPNRLRDDVKGPLHPELEKHVRLEARLRSPVDSPVDNVDRSEDVLENDVDAARHQNTRTASRSISRRSLGCRLSRVVTSTLRPIDSFKRRCTPARSSSEKFCARRDVNEDVEVAVRPCFTAGGRAKQICGLDSASAQRGGADSDLGDSLLTGHRGVAHQAADSGIMLILSRRFSSLDTRPAQGMP